MEISFVTKNPHKVQEVKDIFRDIGVSIVHDDFKIHEIQTEDIEKIARDKILKAFDKVGRPVFTEHTGLYINYLQGFPGGLTQVFWDKLEADKFSDIFRDLENRSLTAKTIIAFCDAKKVHIFEGSIKGSIAPEPRGKREFQWDCIFIPKNYQQTFAEMGEKKDEISMRKLAFNEFREFLISEVL